MFAADLRIGTTLPSVTLRAAITGRASLPRTDHDRHDERPDEDRQWRRDFFQEGKEGTATSDGRSRDYKIYGREYTRTLVLVRPKDYWDCTD